MMNFRQVVLWPLFQKQTALFDTEEHLNDYYGRLKSHQQHQEYCNRTQFLSLAHRGANARRDYWEAGYRITFLNNRRYERASVWPNPPAQFGASGWSAQRQPSTSPACLDERYHALQLEVEQWSKQLQQRQEQRERLGREVRQAQEDMELKAKEMEDLTRDSKVSKACMAC